MKKSLLPVALFASLVAYAQVGINTSLAASTLDVVAKNATGTSSNAEGLLIPRVDRQRAQNMTNVVTSTLIYVNSIATGSTSGIATNIDAVGYYYFDENNVWTKLKTTGGSSDINIYKDNGTLNNNRTVAQSDKTLAFTSTPTTGTSHFSVDGSTFSVDARNNRVGIGTSTPGVRLDVAEPAGISESGLLRVINTSAPVVNNTAYIGFNSYNGGGATWGIGSVQNSSSLTDSNFHILYSSGGLYNKRFTINPNGNVGIGTTAPQKKLHVNGALQVTNELNVGGSDSAPGSAGASGEVLTSKGAGVPPAWTALDASGVVQLSSLALNSVDYSINYAANNWFTIVWNNAPKIDNTKLTYDTGTGQFTVVKSGYYQVLASTHLNMELNASGQTSGTAQTAIMKNASSFAYTSSGHGERTEDVYHTIAGAAYFTVGDKISLRMIMTRNYRIAGSSSFVTITYLGT